MRSEHQLLQPEPETRRRSPTSVGEIRRPASRPLLTRPAPRAIRLAQIEPAQRAIGNHGVRRMLAQRDADEAPVAKTLIPFDRTPLAAPGERIIFNDEFTHSSPSNYQLVYTGAGGTFDSAKGSASKTVAGLDSGNVDFFVDAAWNGKDAVTVKLQVKKVADGSVAQTVNWTFAKKTYYPTTIKQEETEDERPLPSRYTYKVGPDRGKDGKDDYLHQTILEKFGQRTCNIAPDDLKPEWKKAHPGVGSAEAITAHFFGTSSSNGTFTVSAGDKIFDRHSGFRPTLAQLQAALITMKEVYVDLPQTYEAEPGVTLGSYTVRRIMKTDGTKKLKKWKS
jgi:hypothetical protein